MMQLHLLGVLQDFGSPQILLYFEKNKKNLYLELLLSSKGMPRLFNSLLLHVSKNDIYSYLEQKTSIKQIALHATSCLLWEREKNKNGIFKECPPNWIQQIEDDMFDEYFCSQEQLIRYNLEQII